MVPGGLKKSGKEDDNFFVPLLTQVLYWMRESKRVSPMHFCSLQSQRGISQTNHCQRHILLLLKSCLKILTVVEPS